MLRICFTFVFFHQTSSILELNHAVFHFSSLFVNLLLYLRTDIFFGACIVHNIAIKMLNLQHAFVYYSVQGRLVQRR